jgi:hypothetical protein
MLEVSNCSPEIAVPMTVKMPEPMTAPIPRAVSDHGPRLLFSRCSGSSDSRISLSIDLRAKNWLGSAVPPYRFQGSGFRNQIEEPLTIERRG